STLLCQLSPINKIEERRAWVANASRVLASVSSRSRTFSVNSRSPCEQIPQKDCFGVTPKPARETRALPENSARIVDIARRRWHDFTNIKATPFLPPTDSRFCVAAPCEPTLSYSKL